MFTAHVTLKSSTFGSRLQALVAELKGSGSVVWLQGLTLHIEVPKYACLRTIRELHTLLWRYQDVVHCPSLERPPVNLGKGVEQRRVAYRPYRWTWLSQRGGSYV